LDQRLMRACRWLPVPLANLTSSAEEAVLREVVVRTAWVGFREATMARSARGRETLSRVETPSVLSCST
jgi:hypothetical protein